MRYLVFILFLITTASCVKDDFCIEPGVVVMTMNFKTYDSTNKKVDTLLEFASVYNTDTSFLFADNVNNLKAVNVALGRNLGKQTYIVHQAMQRDTMVISYTSQEVFISNGCGYQTYFALKNVIHTTYGIDSINIIEPKVDNNAQNPHLEVIYK